jgi:hypothetical protein
MTFGNHFSKMTMGIGDGQWWYSNFSTVQQHSTGTASASSNNMQQSAKTESIQLVDQIQQSSTQRHRRNDIVQRQ